MRILDDSYRVIINNTGEWINERTFDNRITIRGAIFKSNNNMVTIVKIIIPTSDMSIKYLHVKTGIPSLRLAMWIAHAKIGRIILCDQFGYVIYDVTYVYQNNLKINQIFHVLLYRLRTHMSYTPSLSTISE